MKIGLRDDQPSEEYSEIMAKSNPIFKDESFSDENNSILQEFNSTKDKTDSIHYKEEFMEITKK